MLKIELNSLITYKDLSNNKKHTKRLANSPKEMKAIDTNLYNKYGEINEESRGKIEYDFTEENKYFDRNNISIETEYGRKLLGRKVGDVIDIKTRSGIKKRYQILKIENDYGRNRNEWKNK